MKIRGPASCSEKASNCLEITCFFFQFFLSLQLMIALNDMRTSIKKDPILMVLDHEK